MRSWAASGLKLTQILILNIKECLTSKDGCRVKGVIFFILVIFIEQTLQRHDSHAACQGLNSLRVFISHVICNVNGAKITHGYLRMDITEQPWTFLGLWGCQDDKVCYPVQTLSLFWTRLQNNAILSRESISRFTWD